MNTKFSEQIGTELFYTDVFVIVIHWENSQCSNFNGSQAHTSTCVLWWAPPNTLACNVNHVVTGLAQKPGETPPSPQCSPYIFRLVCLFLFLCLKDLQSGENKDNRELMGLEVWEGASSGTSSVVVIKSCWLFCGVKRSVVVLQTANLFVGGKKLFDALLLFFGFRHYLK